MTQNFKRDFSNNCLYTFLKTYCIKKGKDLIFNKISYKKACFNNDIKGFCEYHKPYYYKSKQFYITRNMDYKKFITALRQICKYKNIKITSNISYSKSKHEISYLIDMGDIAFGEMVETPTEININENTILNNKKIDYN